MFLKFKDKSGNTKFVMRDSDTRPVDPDRLVMDEVGSEEKPAEDAEPNKPAVGDN